MGDVGARTGWRELIFRDKQPDRQDWSAACAKKEVGHTSVFRVDGDVCLLCCQAEVQQLAWRLVGELQLIVGGLLECSSVNAAVARPHLQLVRSECAHSR